VTIHEVAVGLGYLGATLGVVMVVPQIVRIVRHPRLAGVSPLSWALTTMACMNWLIYGVRTHAAPQIPGNVLLVTGAVVVVLLVHHPVSRLRRAAMLGATAAVLMTIAFLLPADLVGYFAFSIGLFSGLPQLADSIANWRGHVNSGVSVSAWTLRIASQSCWLAYAVGTADLAVGISACVVLSTAIAMVVLEVSARSAALALSGEAEAAA
jgi:uncharacterized protein with PQ loop repeat